MGESILEREPPRPDRRLAYGAGPSRFGELWLPAGPGPHPCVVAIHGGFWRARYGLGYLGHLCAGLAELGVATWSIEYRRVGEPGGGWPGTFRDVAAGVGALFANAGRWGIDPGAVVVLGHSAGGQLAVWLAGRGGVPAGSEIAGASPPLRGVVSLAGVLDLGAGWSLGLSEGAVASFLGGAPTERAERYAAACPMALLPIGVRQLVVHGEADESVSAALSVGFHRAATNAGDSSRLVLLPGADHFSVVDPASAVWPKIGDAIVGLVR